MQEFEADHEPVDFSDPFSRASVLAADGRGIRAAQLLEAYGHRVLDKEGLAEGRLTGDEIETAVAAFDEASRYYRSVGIELASGAFVADSTGDAAYYHRLADDAIERAETIRETEYGNRSLPVDPDDED
jgi:hypothetical protein